MTAEILAELKRLRDWRHDKVAPTLLAYGYRLKAVEQNQGTTSNRLGIVEKAVEEIVKADEIAEAISKKIKGRNTLELTIFQRGMAVVIFVIAVADFVRGFH